MDDSAKAQVAIPTGTGPRGIRYDFNDGARVLLPKGDWRVELHDLDSGNVLFRTDIAEGMVTSTKKFYVRFGIRVWQKGKEKPDFSHDMEFAGKRVCVHFPVGTLGDILAWFPYVERFREIHGCQVSYTMADEVAALFSATYPNLHYVAFSEHDDFYASYRMGLFFDDSENCMQPIDFRLVGLHRTAANILGVDDAELPAKLKLDAPRIVEEPYVCIAVQASTQCKKWNNPTGWRDVIRHIKASGYRVLCIDREQFHGQVPAWQYCPPEAEDFTGNRPLGERVALLQHASAFVGLSSGLAWLAWACRVPVVMISGFTLPFNEFRTPYRVFNIHTCTGCWNDVRHRFDHKDFFWCPRHKGTNRQYECSALITSHQVIRQFDRLLQDMKDGERCPDSAAHVTLENEDRAA
ncbi:MULTISPECIES: autotransporter strand-loop-strand O-heptosyltransferase [Paraburkholderia]|uniref:autotransporter strand-loop-strand O-heptosyltransferase n=1 Tax=Paraburkholderia TaxID=1822464 RepID=UPI00224E6CF8|nr:MULTISPECIES: autotransporter strand-loop-strand O-heptosyltransferase [Paraburkholderia]MCX4159654.1 autotransporter strand-loop-strand O-heptosyltransferase [Paraburkholderia aspalathi]MDN7169052.1 autotransporter strand-loop-strand O-heptosyltransferase [Paraburkholderia sp. SECH2]MDQ6397539.1 autotransporter strand-loop-strand O-heptosyltransferase [Paraburkholderia aspalathi]